jgi:hypothetical protein
VPEVIWLHKSMVLEKLWAIASKKHFSVSVLLVYPLSYLLPTVLG